MTQSFDINHERLERRAKTRMAELRRDDPVTYRKRMNANCTECGQPANTFCRVKGTNRVTYWHSLRQIKSGAYR